MLFKKKKYYELGLYLKLYLYNSSLTVNYYLLFMQKTINLMELITK